jgi:TPR repeat protein
MVLASILVLGIAVAPVRAESTPAGAAYPGMDEFQRGWTLDQGLGVPINMPAAIRAYTESAALGNPLARGRLARIYFLGIGVPADQAVGEVLSRQAFPDLLKAAQANDTIAQMIVGAMYAQGVGVGRDSALALSWMQKSADQRLPLAQANLGVLHEKGIGVPADSAEAAKWFRAAADQNCAMGQTYLADLYLEGRGVPCDVAEAARLYRLAADQNFAAAETNLGYIYDHGYLGAPNLHEAVRLYRLAAEQNFAVAQTNLGVMYLNGWGIYRSWPEAVKWFQLAAAQGDEDARQALRDLACPGPFRCRTSWCR